MNQYSVPPHKLHPWLLYEGFLTKKLYGKSGNTCMTILDQRWNPTHWWDRYVLNLDFSSVMHRDIVMMAWDEPCWYARTILPLSTYQSDTSLFDRLKTESLGTLIFDGTQISRVSLIHYVIDKRHIEYHWLTEAMHHHAETLWVRLSTFTVADHTTSHTEHSEGSPNCFYLVEILLPGLEKYL